MDEFISKDKAIKLLENLGGCDAKDEYSKGYDEAILAAIYDVRAIKPADVQPIRHRRWITKAKDYYKAWQDSGRSWDDMPYFVTGEHIACSECFTEYDVCTEGIEHWIGCPCCLARMDGDSK